MRYTCDACIYGKENPCILKSEGGQPMLCPYRANFKPEWMEDVE
jgi:hypothetical protein